MHNQELAPIILFVYNRPSHTRSALESLLKNNLADKSTLYVFADGPKENATEEDLQKIKETRNLFKNLSGLKRVILVEKEKNEGLANSIINGVTEVVNKYGKVIVLEDDLLLSKYFLEFMNEGLNIYHNSSNIYTINGFMFPIKTTEKTTFLLPYISTWGWATWKEKWKIFAPQIPEIDKTIIINSPLIKNRFNLADYNYAEMLNFNNNSWGIKWYYFIFIRGGLNVFPTLSLVSNIGNDGSGTNSPNNHIKELLISENKVKVDFQTTIRLDFLILYESLFLVKKNKFKNLIEKYFKILIR